METQNITQNSIQPEKKKIGIGIGILIIREGKILLGKRHDDPIKADSIFHGEGTWTMPGGTLDYGETFEQGAKREVFEETGIKLNEIKIIGINQQKNERAHFVTVGLYSEDFEGEPRVMEPDEITEWRWFSTNALPRKVYFPSEKLLNNYLTGKFYIEDNKEGF